MPPGTAYATCILFYYTCTGQTLLIDGQAYINVTSHIFSGERGGIVGSA